MDQTLLEPAYGDEQLSKLSRRQHDDAQGNLVLQELEARQVFDYAAADTHTCEIITFGSVRETCPRCPDVHLKLVLRQQNVRFAHFFCPQCATCYDAHYADGASALTI